MAGTPRPGEKWWVRVVALFALLLSAAWLIAALVRRLNFDEALALKSGWLLLSDHRGQPTFLMPITLLMGMVGHLLGSPGTVFTVLRLLVAGSVGGALVWACSRRRSKLEAGVAVCLTLLQQTFIVHGLEFRYDWAILLGLLVCYGACLSPRGPRLTLIGVCLAWLAIHHLKGVYFATCLLAGFALYASVFRRETWRTDVRDLALGAGCVMAVWLALVMALGLGDRLWVTYAEFLELSRTSEAVGLWQALGKAVTRDAGWWLLIAAVIATSGLTGLAKLRGKQALSAQVDLEQVLRNLNGPTALAAAFAGSTLIFLTLHPHPWAYMLALSAPFLAASVATPLTRWLEQGRLWQLTAVLVIAIGAQLGARQPGPLACYLEALSSDREELVTALDELRQRAGPRDTIVDPAGLAYFVPPCEEQWYVDQLFLDHVRDGSWMAAFTPASLQSCHFMLATYRLKWLPRATLVATVQQYRACPAKGLWARADAPDPIPCTRTADLKDDLLASYW